MSRSGTIPFTKKVLLQSKCLASGLRTTRRSQDDGEEKERLIAEEFFAPQSLHRPSPSPQLGVTNPPTSDLDDVILLQHYAQIARELLLTPPFSCSLLSPEDVELMDGQPVAAGGFSDIRKAKNNGRDVVLKEYRCYRLFDIAQVLARFRNEVDVYNLLHHGGVDVVRLIGAYSTETLPFGLVYEYVDNLDLDQFLKKEPNVGRLQLLTEIARCLGRLHGLGIVHGDFRMAHILVDRYGTLRIAGLGNAHILSYSTAWTAGGKTSTERPSRGRAPDLAEPGMSPDVTNVTHPTKAGDMYTFGFMAFEVLTGQPPFSGMAAPAATHSMLNGFIPSLPDRHEVSDLVWGMIQSCWNPVESSRMLIEEVVTLLEAELSRLPTPSL